MRQAALHLLFAGLNGERTTTRAVGGVFLADGRECKLASTFHELIGDAGL
jgi:hypothetical protein